MKIVFLNLLSVVNLFDSAFDAIFFILVYGTNMLWLAILVCLSYIYSFCDRLYNTKKLIILAKDQYKQRKIKNLLEQGEN